MIRSGRGPNPLTFLAALLVVGGLFGIVRDRLEPVADDGLACDAALDLECVDALEAVNPFEASSFAAAGPAVPAAEACRGAGYLCEELETEERIRVQRWKDFEGTIVVRVPMPDFEDRAEARRLRRAAVAGIRLWNGQPFPITVVEREDREAHFSVRWSRGLGGSRIGVARTQWSPSRGLEVVSLELATRSPFRTDRVIEPRQLQLTAAHEMGHALGLPHSGSPRDVMYPTSTATSLTGQDYRTMQALYRLSDGTEIVR